MYFIITIILFLYALVITRIAYAWKTKISVPVSPDESLPSVSVVIPFRNEAGNLPVLLESLLNQDYPPELFEIIAVDDHSTDDSIETLGKFSGQIKTLTNMGSGKKAALTTGIHHSKSVLIFTIDADCVVGENWLSTSVKNLLHENALLQTGPVFLKETRSFAEHFQAMEWMALMSVTSFQIEKKQASLANGANLLFYRDTFMDVGGYAGNENIASGDDQFLLEKIKLKHPDRIAFAKHPDCIVKTNPAESFNTLLQQKVRWAGKWKKQKGWGILLAPMLFMVHVLFLWTSIYMFWNPFLPLGVILFIAAHGYLFYKLSRFFGYKLPVFSFLMANFAYSAYAIAVGVLTLKRRSYIWKGRKIDVR